MASSQPSSQTVSDRDRKQIEAEIAGAMLLLYSGHRAQALASLGITDAGTIPLDAHRRILDFAEQRAQQIQDGINSRMDGADDPAAMQASITDYNTTTLQPYLASWSMHQAVVDAYTETPAPDGEPMRDAVQWEWQQNTSHLDDCTEADAASPASYDELVSITGGPPPVHENCACTLSPV